MANENNKNQGYRHPSEIQIGSAFNVGGVQQPQSGAERLGQPNVALTAPGLSQYDEDANAAFVLAPDLDRVMRSSMAQVPFAIPIQGEFTKNTADYNSLSNYEYVRDAAAVVGALGRNDQTQIQGLAVGSDGDFEFACASVPNLILGYVIEWSLQLQTSAAFTMKVKTEGYRGMSNQSVDRTFSMRIGGGELGAGNGGIFAFLFAQRLDTKSPGDGYYYPGIPYTGIEPDGTGGMMKAVVQPAAIVPYMGPGMYIPGTTLAPNEGGTGPEAIPDLTVTVPSTLADGFGAFATPITAASPYLAMVRRALRIDG